MTIETVKQTLVVALRDDLERGGREKVANAILDLIWERDADMYATR